ncbi:unnamed protein product [Pleuronectes platessa]|uniref:Uncharacterized protein n=1 Tax=Pleuronectes platessa TaxID=8262 RepID=A0A9N7Z5J5_PLEPL|nr:unnamed protein product [Pleuronectes platessa]
MARFYTTRRTRKRKERKEIIVQTFTSEDRSRRGVGSGQSTQEAPILLFDLPPPLTLCCLVTTWLQGKCGMKADTHTPPHTYLTMINGASDIHHYSPEQQSDVAQGQRSGTENPLSQVPFYGFAVSGTCEEAAGPQPLVIRPNCLETRAVDAHTKGRLQGEEHLPLRRQQMQRHRGKDGVGVSCQAAARRDSSAGRITSKIYHRGITIQNITHSHKDVRSYQLLESGADSGQPTDPLGPAALLISPAAAAPTWTALQLLSVAQDVEQHRRRLNGTKQDIRSEAHQLAYSETDTRVIINRVPLIYGCLWMLVSVESEVRADVYIR